MCRPNLSVQVVAACQSFIKKVNINNNDKNQDSYRHFDIVLLDFPGQKISK